PAMLRTGRDAAVASITSGSVVGDPGSETVIRCTPTAAPVRQAIGKVPSAAEAAAVPLTTANGASVATATRWFATGTPSVVSIRMTTGSASGKPARADCPPPATTRRASGD